MVSDDSWLSDALTPALAGNAMIAGVQTASSADAFWDESEPDVTVLDATPSVLDALAAQVHAAARRPGIVLLVVTGAPGEDVHTLGREAGAVGYVKRDDDLPGLAAAILGLAALAGVRGREDTRPLTNGRKG